MELPNLVSLEEALKHETIGVWDFYAAVTGHDWFNEPSLGFGRVHPFKFTRQNKDQIYKLIEKLKKHYQENYEPEDKSRKYYESHFDEIDLAFEGTLKKQKEAIRGLLTAIVLD